MPPGSRIAIRRRAFTRWSAALLALCLALAILHQIVPSPAHRDDCSLCRVLRSPSMPAVATPALFVPPRYHVSLPESERTPLAQHSLSLEPPRGPPALPSV